MGTRKSREYCCHIEKEDRAKDFELESDLWGAVDRQCLKEWLEVLPQEGLDAFLRRFVALKASACQESKSRQALGSLFKILDLAIELANGNEANANSALDELVCTRALHAAVHELVALRESLKNHVLKRAPCARMEGSLTGIDPSLRLEHWKQILGRVTFKKMPGHRRRVFIALHDCGALVRRGDSRFLAIASLLAGARPVKFVPGETTVADVIQAELSQMRGLAVRIAPYWANDSEVEAWPPAWKFNDEDPLDEHGRNHSIERRSKSRSDPRSSTRGPIVLYRSERKPTLAA